MVHKNRLIIFFIPPDKIVNGGILSIFSIAATSRKFASIHKAKVVLATYPGTKSYQKNDLFENDERIYSFDELVKRGAPDFLMMHVPEYASYDVCQTLKAYSDYLGKIPDLRVNIMNQNILLMQPPIEVANWFGVTPVVTQTIAHNKYATQEIADKYDLPTRHLSTFVDPGQYSWTDFEKKQDLILLSNDLTDKKDQIVASIKKQLPKYKVVTIENMQYEEYKKLISKARFTITFGEGFDGYYVEGFFSGGITFAVYNDDFFPDKEFSKFDNTYGNYDKMLDLIVSDIKKLAANKDHYQKVVKENFDKIAKLYSFESYTNNIKKFYEGEFSFMPNQTSAEKLLGVVVRNRDEQIKQKDQIIGDMQQRLTAAENMEKTINEKTEEIQKLNTVINEMVHSKSWKITKPLRKITALKKKRA